MQITITIDQASKITALSRATASYNTANDVTLTDAQFLQLVVDQNLDAYVATHTKTALTKFEFLNRFTQAERVSIRTAAASNAELYDFMQMLEISGEVQLNNPSTQAGIAFLEAGSLIAVGRAAEILAV
jgi:hypothetical protein